MRDLWKRDLVYVMRVLSGMDGEPRVGVMRSRSVRKDVMSKSWSARMSIFVGMEEQSAAVMPLPIATIEVQRVRATSSLRGALVRIGRIDFKMARDEVVAWRHGDILFVMIGNEYLRPIGLASAVRAEDKAPLV